MPEPALDADRPITDPSSDLLGRAHLVDQLERWVHRAPTSDGFVIGLTGEWGSGKTSVLNLLEARIASDATVVRFDPWLFSGADQLVLRFFDELAAELAHGKGKKLKELGARMSEYGAALSPAAGLLLGPAAQLLASPEQVSAVRRLSAASKRKELRDALLSRPRRIVVLIDDIDRLDPLEVVEVLRLVKLVADLPGVVHVLSYARRPVEAALAHVGHEDGHAYLEKIVQASVAVPPVSKDRLRAMTFGWLDQVVGARGLESWQPQAWSRLVDGGVDEYFRTVRDGRRYANMAPAALDLCGDEVAAMDTLALEAVRIFDPEVHEILPKHVRLLTGRRDAWDFRSKQEIDNANRAEADLLLANSAHPIATRTVLRELFPACANLFGGSATWNDPDLRVTKRVASHPVFMRYLHLALATGEAPSALVDSAVDALADGESLRALLADVDDATLHDLLERLRARVGEQAAPDVLGSASAILDLGARMRRPAQPFEADDNRRITWVVEDLLELLPLAERVAAAQTLIAQGPTLSLRVHMLYRFRSVPDKETRQPQLELLEPAAFNEAQRTLVEDLLSRKADELLEEDYLLWLLGEVTLVEGQPAALKVLGNRALLLAVLTTSGTRVRPCTDNRISFNIEPLVEIAGDEVVDLLQALEREDELGPDDREALSNALIDRRGLR